ncbi:helix-turn-helix domain-containing protein [Cellulomonas sp. 73-92]|uniref:helix-turn-helix domain-containing protein n=1 Tax=Cellulomonas sp. 73-92 TaxID=1895740 RepID=UPI0025C65B3B|nr:helix-turn-helix domain-containing protein [Cellulomonas sp. 73-92]
MADPPASNGRSGRGPSVPGVVRAAAILTELARADGQSLSDLAGHVRLPKSTAFDVCSGLAAHELLTRDSDGRYHLGRHIETLASSWVDGTSALQRFARVCATQDELDGKTVTLHTLAGSSVLCLDVRLGTQPLPETPRPGVRLGLTDSGPGAAILTAATDEELDALLRRAAGFEGLATQEIAAIRAVGAQFRRGRRAVPSPDGTVALARARAAGEGRSWLAVAVLLPARNGSPGSEGVVAAIERVLDALVGAVGATLAP